MMFEFILGLVLGGGAAYCFRTLQDIRKNAQMEEALDEMDAVLDEIKDSQKEVKP
jgi:hypothetical protein